VSDWNPSKERDGKVGSRGPARAALWRVEKAQELVEFLMDADGFFEGTANDLAVALGWIDTLKKGKHPDRRLVNDCCTLTREQEYNPELKSILGGCVVAYRANKGGFVLVDPTGASQVRQWLALFKGDMQRQQQQRTENRRRLPYWQALGDQMANNGDLEFATLCWQIKAEIEKTGDYSDGLISRFWQLVRTRPEFEEAAA
jgi:hypothetical protein